MSRNYQKLLAAGNAAQLEKLKENKHKDGWDHIRLTYAIDRLNQEVDELILAKHRGSIQEIRREAADIANFAHMIILTCDRSIEESE